MQKIIDLLAGITEETTLEQARGVIADVVDECQKVVDDIRGFNSTIDELNMTNAELTDKVAQLQEENGRLFRERVRTVEKAVVDTLDVVEKTPEQEAEELLAQISY